MKNGRLIYVKYPFEAYMKPLTFKHLKLVAYSMSGLRQRDKIGLSYKLYGRRSLTNGIVDELNGVKVSDGSLLVSAESSEALIDLIEALRSYGVKFNVYDIYMPAVGA